MNDPFISVRDRGSVQTKLVSGPSLRVTRAASMSFGKNAKVEEVAYIPENIPIEEWFSNDLDKNLEPSPGTGFGTWYVANKDTLLANSYPIENYLDNAKEVDRIKEAAAPDVKFRSRIHRDPLTNIPSNVAEVDRSAESTSFFGALNNHNELEEIIERSNQVTRLPEHVDYVKAKSIPIKFMKSP